MKTPLKVFCRILFFIAILSCYGLNSYANDVINPSFAEFPVNADNEMTIISDIDSLNDDQIPHLNFHYSYTKPVCLVPVLKVFSLMTDSMFSIWQPPQL